MEGDVTDRPKQSQAGFFATIPTEILFDQRLTHMACRIYGAIATLTLSTGFCWASNSYFARRFECAPETVSRAVKQLIDGGYIRAEIDTDAGNIRRIYLLISVSRGIDADVKTPIDVSVKHNNNNSNKDKGIKDPPDLAPPKGKKEAESFDSYRRSQYHLEKDDLPDEFFDWFEVEIMGRWDKSSWTCAIVRDVHDHIWAKHGSETATAAASEVKASHARGWQMPYAEVVRVANIQANKAKAEAERTKRLEELAKRRETAAQATDRPSVVAMFKKSLEDKREGKE
jgi:hypothetical protein